MMPVPTLTLQVLDAYVNFLHFLLVNRELIPKKTKMFITDNRNKIPVMFWVERTGENVKVQQHTVADAGGSPELLVILSRVLCKIVT